MVGFLPFSFEAVLHDVKSAGKSRNSGSWPVRTAPEAVELEDVVPQATISSGREDKLDVVHQAIENMIHGLFQCSDEGFLTSTSAARRWNMFPLVAYYCFDIAEAQGM